MYGTFYGEEAMQSSWVAREESEGTKVKSLCSIESNVKSFFRKEIENSSGKRKSSGSEEVEESMSSTSSSSSSREHDEHNKKAHVGLQNTVAASKSCHEEGTNLEKNSATVGGAVVGFSMFRSEEMRVSERGLKRGGGQDQDLPHSSSESTSKREEGPEAKKNKREISSLIPSAIVVEGGN